MAGITVNKNTIPYDQQKPNITSGIRIGTPAVTTRGMQPEHMVTIGRFIDRALQSPGDEAVLNMLRIGSGGILFEFSSLRGELLKMEGIHRGHLLRIPDGRRPNAG